MIRVASSRVDWHGPSVTQAIRNTMKERLAIAGDALAAKVRENISVQGPPGSLPGEFPHRESGELEESIRVKLDRRSLSVEVIAGAKHAAIVEEQRPFLRRTLREQKPTIRRILLGDSGGKGMFKFTS